MSNQGVQLKAISNISSRVARDYATLTSIMSNPTESNSLVPYIKIWDVLSNRVLFDNATYLHNPNLVQNSDIILDLLNMQIEVGKNGIPSLISGSIKFKILNANKFITKENEIKIPGLFSLLSYKRLKFGWADPRFNMFDEQVIESKFDHSTDTQNTAIVTMHVGSPLLYFNKIEHTMLGGLKDTSTLNTKKRNKFSINYNGKILFSQQVIDNIIESELKDGPKSVSFIKMFDNILYDFRKSEKQYTNFEFNRDDESNKLGLSHIFSTNYGLGKLESGITQINIGNLLKGIDNNGNIALWKTTINLDGSISIPIFNQHDNIDRNRTSNVNVYMNSTKLPIMDLTKNIAQSDFYRFDSSHHFSNVWYGNVFDFSEYAPNKYLNIIPRISRYNQVQGSGQNISIFQEPSIDGPTGYNSFKFSFASFLNDHLNPSTGLVDLEYYFDGLDVVAIYDTVYMWYYQQYLWDSKLTPFKVAYEPDGNGGLNIVNTKTIERERLELLSKIYIEYILELRKIIKEIYTKDGVTKEYIREKIKVLYNGIKQTVITEPKFLQLLLPSITDMSEYENKFDIPNEKINWSSSVSVVDLVTMLELNLSFRGDYPNSILFYDKENWINLIESLDDLSAPSTSSGKVSQVPSSISKTAVNIFNCYRTIATWFLKDIVKKDISPVGALAGAVEGAITWELIYYGIMSVQDEATKSTQEEIQENIEKLTEQETGKRDTFSIYELDDNLRLIDIVNDWNVKLNRMLKPEHKIQFSIYKESPSLPQNRQYSIKWKDREISIMGTAEKGDVLPLTSTDFNLNYLLIPNSIYKPILQRGTGIFQILREIFEHFRTYFNLNLDYSVYREGQTTIIEIFCLDLINGAIESWNGDLDFKSISDVLGNRFVVLDYRSSNSIVTSFNANVKTQDSLFLSFMPAQTDQSILALFKTGSEKSENLSEEALDNLVKIYTKVFRPPDTPEEIKEGKFQGMLNKVQQYYNSGTLQSILDESEVIKGGDPEYFEALVNFYQASGTYPAHLLFGGFSISVELIGLNGFTSFQIIGIRNTGIYDGLYMVETVNHYLDKTTFKTTVNCKLLMPRIRTIKEN